MYAATHISGLFGKLLRQTVGPLLGISVVAYFAYYTVHGDRGLKALAHFQAEVEKAESVLAQVRSEREELERRAMLLRPDSLDPDMLEERARIVLNHVHPDDLVILLPGRPAPQQEHGLSASGR